MEQLLEKLLEKLSDGWVALITHDNAPILLAFGGVMLLLVFFLSTRRPRHSKDNPIDVPETNIREADEAPEILTIEDEFINVDDINTPDGVGDDDMAIPRIGETDEQAPVEMAAPAPAPEPVETHINEPEGNDPESKTTKKAEEAERLAEIERKMLALRELYEAGLIAPEIYVIKAREFAEESKRK
ncbi:MAG: hypothetical protein ACR2OT_06975 [Parvibaculales bacterium]